MPEIRFNRITGDSVIVATERSRRPEDFTRRKERRESPPYIPTCPFCPGNEDKAPPETFRLPAGGGWAVRAMANKFPALSAAGEVRREGTGFKKAIAGVGFHEVIVETPRHDLAPALLPVPHVEQLLEAYRHRFLAFYEDPRIEHVIVFKNHGESAGTSLEHPHSQIVGTPVVPGQVRARIREASRSFDDFGECLYCWCLREELAEGVRIVAEGADFAAFIPYAALSPFHLWIFPKRHVACFGTISRAEMASLAAILKEILLRIYVGLENPDLNYVIRSVSPHDGPVKHFHWYLSIVVRVSTVAGFELGTGMFINTALPEESARFLREVRL